MTFKHPKEERIQHQQPETQLIAKRGVNRSIGKPILVYTLDK